MSSQIVLAEMQPNLSTFSVETIILVKCLEKFSLLSYYRNSIHLDSILEYEMRSESLCVFPNDLTPVKTPCIKYSIFHPLL